jgi:hypothetical protein
MSTPVTMTVTAMAMVLVAACGSASHTAASTTPSTVAAATTTTSTLPAGYTTFSDVAYQFSIGVPSSWNQVDPSSPGATKALQTVVADNPKMKAAYGGGPASFVASGTKFLAFDTDQTADFTPNLNIIAKPATGIANSDLPSLLPGLRTEFQKLGGTVTASSQVPVAGLPGFQINLQLPTTLPSGGKLTVLETQDYVVANGYFYALTFAGTAPEFSTILSTFSIPYPGRRSR